MPIANLNDNCLRYSMIKKQKFEYYKVDVVKLDRTGFDELVNVAKWINEDNHTSFVSAGWVKTGNDDFFIDGGLCAFLFYCENEAQEFVDFVNKQIDKEYCVYILPARKPSLL